MEVEVEGAEVEGCSSRLKGWRLRGCSLRLRCRGAEAGGILGVNTPPTFWGTQKWKLERVGNKKLGGGKFLGGGKNFRRGKKFFRGCKMKEKGGCAKKKERSSKKIREI